MFQYKVKLTTCFRHYSKHIYPVIFFKLRCRCYMLC